MRNLEKLLSLNLNFLGVDATGLKSGPTGVKEWKKDLINMEKKNAAGDKNAADSEFYF